MHVTSATRSVARLFLDLNRVPSTAKKASRVMEMGRHRYYSLEGAIEATYGSAMVTYAVKLGGRSNPYFGILLMIQAWSTMRSMCDMRREPCTPMAGTVVMLTREACRGAEGGECIKCQPKRGDALLLIGCAHGIGKVSSLGLHEEDEARN